MKLLLTTVRLYKLDNINDAHVCRACGLEVFTNPDTVAHVLTTGSHRLVFPLAGQYIYVDYDDLDKKFEPFVIQPMRVRRSLPRALIGHSPSTPVWLPLSENASTLVQILCWKRSAHSHCALDPNVWSAERTMSTAPCLGPQSVDPKASAGPGNV